MAVTTDSNRVVEEAGAGSGCCGRGGRHEVAVAAKADTPTPRCRLTVKVVCLMVISGLIAGLMWHQSRFIYACVWGDCRMSLRSGGHMSNLRAVPQCPIKHTPLSQITQSVGGAYWTWMRAGDGQDAHPMTRPFPKVFIIGAQKCGTSTLWNMFDADPNVRVAWRHDMSEKSKELHFFDRSPEVYASLGLEWYLKHWDYMKDEADWSQYVLLDATPDYMAEGHSTPRRILEAFPLEASQLRFIVMLCNPMERAYSLWTMAEREPWNGWAKALPLEEGFGVYVRRYASAMNKCVERLPAAKRMTELQQFQECVGELPDLLYRGMYWPQLQVWFQYFARDQFLLIDNKQLFGPHGLEVQRRIREFVGLPVDVTFEQPRKWESAHRKLATDDPTTYRLLRNFYKPYTDVMVRDGALCGFNVTAANLN